MRKLTVTAAFVTLLMGMGAASAEDRHDCGNAPESQWMSKDAVKAKYAVDGTEVRKVKVEDGCYEVYAVTKDGKKTERIVHPVTGEVVGTEDDEG
jgi:hypothetical protein